MMRAARLALAGLLLAGVSLGQAGEGVGPAGTWKITLPLAEKIGDKPLWLVKLDNKDGKWIGTVSAHAENMPEATLEKLSVTKDTLRFSLKMPNLVFPFEFRLPAEKSAKLYGILKRGGGVNPAEMEQTTLADLSERELLKEALATRKENTTILRSALALIETASANKAKAEEVRSWAARASKAAGAYGPRWHREILLALIEMLDKQKGYESIALTYARQAERMLEDTDRPAIRKRVLEGLSNALTKAGKADEAKEVETRIKKIDLTIKPMPFAGRKGKSDRVVLVELFTGAECPPCVAADLAFDALGKTFKPGEVVRLQYHLHVPGPDPLTNPDSEARADYYSRFVRGTPTVLADGKPLAPGGGGTSAGWDKYDEYVEELTPMLEGIAKVKLQATATRQGAKVHIDVTASDVRADSDDLRLRGAGRGAGRLHRRQQAAGAPPRRSRLRRRRQGREDRQGQALHQEAHGRSRGGAQGLARLPRQDQQGHAVSEQGPPARPQGAARRRLRAKRRDPRSPPGHPGRGAPVSTSRPNRAATVRERGFLRSLTVAARFVLQFSGKAATIPARFRRSSRSPSVPEPRTPSGEEREAWQALSARPWWRGWSASSSSSPWSVSAASTTRTSGCGSSIPAACTAAVR